MAGFLSRWRKKQRQKHMLDGPGMVNVPAPIRNGKERQCTSCGCLIAPQHQTSALCPQCGAKLPPMDESAIIIK